MSLWTTPLPPPGTPGPFDGLKLDPDNMDGFIKALQDFREKPEDERLSAFRTPVTAETLQAWVP